MKIGMGCGLHCNTLLIHTTGLMETSEGCLHSCHVFQRSRWTITSSEVKWAAADHNWLKFNSLDVYNV